MFEPIQRHLRLIGYLGPNYRGIALSSIFGKILDRITLSRYADKLIASQYQFGLKKSSYTEMCTMVLKETINYYTLNKGHM